MIKKILPLALSLALAISPAAEVFAASEQVDVPVEASSSEATLTDESVGDTVDAGLAEDNGESLTENPAEEQRAEETVETADEFSAEGFIFRKTEENEAVITGVLEENSEVAIPGSVIFEEEELPVTAVLEGALSGESVEKIYIPASVKEFGSQVLPALTSVEADEENEVLEVVDGVLFSKGEEGSSSLVLYPAALEGENYVVPEGTTAIARNAFCGNTGLEVIVIGEDVEAIEAGAFSGLKEKVRIAFLRDNAEVELQEGSFAFMPGDDSVIYFENEDILNEILMNSPDFAVAEAEEEEPAAEETAVDESAVEEPADEEPADEESAAEESVPEEIAEEVPAFTLNAEGIPDDILDIVESLEAGDDPGMVAAGDDAAIARGYYQITNAKRYYRMVQISGGKIVASYVTSNRNTLFQIVPVGDEKYAIINFESGNAAALASAPANYVSVVEAAYTGADSQKWYIRKVDDAGTVEIVPVLDESLRLELKDDNQTAGLGLVVNKSNGQLYQAWKFTEKENVAVSLETGTYSISTYANKNIVVETADGSLDSGANVKLASNMDARYQQFTITALGYGNYYKVENLRSGKVWDVAGGSKASGANIQQYTWNGTGAQIFQVIETEESGEKVYQFIGKASGLAVDYTDGGAKAGTNICLNKSNGSKTQKFKLTKVDPTTVPGVDAKITEGYYKIYSALSTDYAVGVLNFLDQDGKSAVMCKADQMDGAIFQIVPTSGERYKVIFAASGKLLTYVGDYAEAHVDIVHRTGTGSSGQEWYIRKKNASDDAYVFVSADNPQVVMDLSGGMAKLGRNVRLYKANGTTAQTWKLKAASNPNTHVLANGIYSIANMNKTSMVMAVSGGSVVTGGNIVISAKTATAPSQLFKIEAIGTTGNEYKITNVWSGLSLDVAGGSKSSGANLQQYTWNNSTAQRFKIIQVTDGSSPSYKIIGSGGGKAIDVASGKTAEGTNVRMYTYNASAAQLWQFNKVSSINTVVTGTAVNFVSKVNAGYKLGWKINTTGLTAQLDLKSIPQAFRIETVSSGVYRIYNLGSGSYLTADGTSGVKFAEWTGAAAQKWKLKATGAGDYSFYIVSASNGNYLTSLTTLKDGSGVWLAAGNAAKAKMFTLKPAAIQSGWVEIDGQWRYYNGDGTFLKDQFYEDGKYYFNSQGYASTGWAKYGAYYYYYKGKDGRETYDTRPYLSALFGTKTSWHGYTCPNCSYHLSVDTVYPCEATVYTTFPGTSGWNLPVFSFYVSPGTTDEYGHSLTLSGNRRVGSKSRWQELMGPSYGQYATVIETYTYVAGSNNQIIDWTNTGQYIHSVACGEANNHNLDPNVYNLLGSRQSHGCVRVPVRYAYWIYEFMERNQGIGVGENLVRPLNTLPLPRAITSNDPTDPAYTGNYGYTDTQNYVNWNGYIVR